MDLENMDAHTHVESVKTLLSNTLAHENVPLSSLITTTPTTRTEDSNNKEHNSAIQGKMKAEDALEDTTLCPKRRQRSMKERITIVGRKRKRTLVEEEEHRPSIAEIMQQIRGCKECDADARESLAKKIAQFVLDNEPNVYVLANILKLVPTERIIQSLEKTLEIERNGGLLTKIEPRRRRTSGGIFMELCVDTWQQQRQLGFKKLRREKESAVDKYSKKKDAQLYSLKISDFIKEDSY